MLVSHGADPSARSKEGTTAADWALKRGMADVARLLAVDATTGPTAPPAPVPPDLAKYGSLAQDVLFAFETGHAGAMARLQAHYGRPFTWEEMRAGVRERLDKVPESKRPDGYFALPHAQLLAAQEAGFDNWAALEMALAARSTPAAPAVSAGAPAEALDLTARMIQPVEMRATLPMQLREGVLTTTTDVWSMLTACRDGDLERVKTCLASCPALVLCDYNYMAPLHLAVREGHVDLVGYLANLGAANPKYVTYPYRETLVTVARDRGYEDIAQILQDRYRTGDPARPEDEGGEIDYGMDADQRRFQKLLNTNAVGEIETLLKQRPALAHNPFAFWSEGVLMMPAKSAHRTVIELLMRYGARVPDVSKWGAWYYLWHYEIAAFLLEHGMNPNHMNCHHTTVLHDMAYKGDTRKAALLLDHGADLNAIDEEFRSTPLGLAARWGHRSMVGLLLERGADPNLSGAPWATPLAWARKKGHAGIESDLRQAGAR